MLLVRAGTEDAVHSDGQADGPGPAAGETGAAADAKEDGTATT